MPDSNPTDPNIPQSQTEQPATSSENDQQTPAEPAQGSADNTSQGEDQRQPSSRPTPPKAGTPRQPHDRSRFPKGFKPKQETDKPPEIPREQFIAMRPSTRDLDQSIEDELNAAFSGFNVDSTLARTEKPSAKPAPGSPAKKKGSVISVRGKDVFVDIPGGRSQGVLSIDQFDHRPQIGDDVEFEIEGYDAANGLLKLTMQGSVQVVTDWSSISQGMVVEARVTGSNKNKTGLLIEVNGIKGFMPISQIDLGRVENLDQFLNQRLKCEVIELDPSERNLVVSRKALLERERLRQQDAFWETLEEGQVKEGVVTSVKPFGAFVNLGPADGLIPISELSWSRVEDPTEIVQIGQKVEVVVHRLDRVARKIGLSLRSLVRSPWDDFAQENRTGSRINGQVTRIAEFGAFVEVAPGVEGLVHISELSTQRVRRVRDVVSEGQTVEVQVLQVDPAARRLSLSLKSLEAIAEDQAEAAAEADEQADREALEERMAKRKPNPNLRGGVGDGQIEWERL